MPPHFPTQDGKRQAEIAGKRMEADSLTFQEHKSHKTSGHRGSDSACPWHPNLTEESCSKLLSTTRCYFLEMASLYTCRSASAFFLISKF